MRDLYKHVITFLLSHANARRFADVNVMRNEWCDTTLQIWNLLGTKN